MKPQWLTETAIAQVEQNSPEMANYLRELQTKDDNYQPFKHPRYWAAFICIGNPEAIGL